MSPFLNGFHTPNTSVIETINFAIGRLIGPALDNKDWNMMKSFQTFLEMKGVKRNRIFDAKSSRFGKNPEMATLIFYHFRYR